MKRHSIFPAFCLAALVIAGCETLPSRDLPPDVPGEPEEPAGTPSGATDTAAQSASARLREEGVRQLEAGDTERASSWLERAIRIDPTSAENYYQLARVRILEGFHAEARELLLRARTLLDSQGLGAGELTGAIERLLAYVARQATK